MSTTMSKQGKKRRSFTKEFKAGAVKLVLDEGKTIAQVARERVRHFPSSARGSEKTGPLSVAA